MSTPTDRIRFAHWVDLNEMDHVGVDSDALWSELEVLEAAETLGPRMPEVGDIVRVRYSSMRVMGEVTKVEGFRFTIGSFSMWLSFTTDDLVAVEEDDSAPE